MSLLFGRRASAQVGPLLFQGIRLVFRVQRTSTKEPNKATVTLYNLAEATRAQLSQLKRPALVVTAGYETTEAVLFSGDVRPQAGVRHVKQGPDWLTTVESADGLRAYTGARFSGSFKAGTPVVEVARALAKSLGLGLGNLEASLAKGGFRQGQREYASGYSAQGNAGVELARLMRSLGFEYSVQDGQLLVLRREEVLPGQAVLLASARDGVNTGIKGSPELTPPTKPGEKPTLRARAFLQPALKPGVAVTLETASVRGTFKVQTVVHTGDTHGQQWDSECTFLGV